MAISGILHPAAGFRRKNCIAVYQDRRRQPAIQNTRFPTSGAYNCLLQWVVQERACFINKETNVKTAYRMAVAAVLGLGVAASAIAHPGEMGGAMGPGAMGGMGHGGMSHDAMGPGAMGGQQLMTPEERTALMEKMRSAKTPEERQKIAAANRAEMEKRAKEKGITLPAPHGPGMGFGPGFQAQNH
jgi:hypothetical protein